MLQVFSKNKDRLYILTLFYFLNRLMIQIPIFLKQLKQGLQSGRGVDSILITTVFCVFLKPFFKALKGKILRSSERAVNSILTTILRF